MSVEADDCKICNREEKVVASSVAKRNLHPNVDQTLFIDIGSFCFNFVVFLGQMWMLCILSAFKLFFINLTVVPNPHPPKKTKQKQQHYRPPENILWSRSFTACDTENTNDLLHVRGDALLCLPRVSKGVQTWRLHRGRSRRRPLWKVSVRFDASKQADFQSCFARAGQKKQ